MFGKYNIRTFDIYFEADSQCLQDDIVYKVQISSFDVVPQSVYSANRIVKIIGVKFEKIYNFHYGKLKSNL